MICIFSAPPAAQKRTVVRDTVTQNLLAYGRESLRAGLIWGFMLGCVVGWVFHSV